MKIVIIGAHPDDPEAGCGGLAYKAVRDGHQVDFLYVTNGDKGGVAPEGESLAEVREREARDAAALCGAEPYFFRYGDQELPFDPVSLSRMKEFLKDSRADLILSHWPSDFHQDHQVCGVLATQCIKSLENTGLAFYEACIGRQTFGMTANRYLDISDVVDVKHRMVECHKSQSPENFWWRHEVMHEWYGALCGVARAEAYMLHVSTPMVEEFFLRGK